MGHAEYIIIEQWNGSPPKLSTYVAIALIHYVHSKYCNYIIYKAIHSIKRLCA